VPNPPAVLMVELVMSIDRMIQSAQNAEKKQPHLAIPGEWPAQVVLGHVSQVDEQVWIPRIAQMCSALAVGDEPPSFVWWEPDASATLDRFKDVSLSEASALAMAARTQLLSVVKELTPEQWSATAEHEAFGHIDVSGLIIQILTHDEEHRASLV
jgi:hypothetical protein